MTLRFQSISLLRLSPSTLYFSRYYGALPLSIIDIRMMQLHKSQCTVHFGMVHFDYALCTICLCRVHFHYAPCALYLVTEHYRYSWSTSMFFMLTICNAMCTLVQCISTMHTAPLYSAFPQRQCNGRVSMRSKMELKL